MSFGVINENIPFDVETDASDVAISAKLNQNSRLSAFHSRSQDRNKLRQSSVKKKQQLSLKLFGIGIIYCLEFCLN